MDNKNNNTDSRFPLARALVLFSILIMLLNGAVVAHRAIYSYHESIALGKNKAETLMHNLSDHAELTFIAADLTLRRAVERQYFNALFGQNLKEDMQHNFISWVNDTPQISAMLMTDENGKIHVSHQEGGVAEWPKDKASLQSHKYFQIHKEADDPDLIYNSPLNIKTDIDGVTLMSRRLSKLDGSFGGIVMAAIKNIYLIDFFEAIEGEHMTNFALLHEQNTALINHSLSYVEIGDLQNELVTEHPPSARGTITTITRNIDSSIIDNTTQIIAFENIPNFKLTLAVVLYGDDIFAVWREERIQDAAFFGMFALFAMVISFFATVMSKQIQRVQTSEKTAVLASQAKSEFLANMSHELRTPLNAIIGFSEMLDSGYFGKLNGKQKERITDINLCGYHLLELINDVLEFSKGEAGKIELRQEKMHIANTISECVRIMNDRAKAQGIILENKLSDSLPQLYADTRKIKQVMLNLLSNAIKFTPKDGKVTTTCYINEEGNFVIAVTDTGIGMDKADIPKALSVFGQVHGDVKYGGTGLGLPLCKMFAELHGGKISIESQKGSGTTVYITLPAARIIWTETAKKSTS